MLIFLPMESSILKVAIAQTTASSDIHTNLQKMETFARTAKKMSAQLIVFPEMAYFLGNKTESEAIAQRYPEFIKLFSDWAKKHQTYLIPGTLREPDPKGSSRLYNTLPLFGPDGRLLAEYRKIFLFKANLPDRIYDEGKTFLPGEDATVVELPWGKTGLSICYDLRFPELFRHQRSQGCRLQILPSAFTVPTGKAHWDPLTRARAIENQFFSFAPGSPASVEMGGRHTDILGSFHPGASSWRKWAVLKGCKSPQWTLMRFNPLKIESRVGSSGELLGPKLYEALSVTYLGRLILEGSRPRSR